MKSIIIFCFLVIVAECYIEDNAENTREEILTGRTSEHERDDETNFVNAQYADDSCLYLSKNHPDYIQKRCSFDDDYYYVCLHNKPLSVEPVSLNLLCSATPEDKVTCFGRKGLNNLLEAFGCRFRFQEFPYQEGNKTNFCIAKQEVQEKLRPCAYNLRKIGLRGYDKTPLSKTFFEYHHNYRPKFNFKFVEYINDSCLYLSPKNLDYYESCSPEENLDSVVCLHHKEGQGSPNFLCKSTRRDTVKCTSRKAINENLDIYGCGFRFRSGNHYNYCIDIEELIEKRRRTCKKHDLIKEYKRGKRRLLDFDFIYSNNIENSYTFHAVEYRDEICNNLSPQHPDYIIKCSDDDTTFSFICIHEQNTEGSLQELCTKKTKPWCVRVKELNDFLRTFRCGFSFKGRARLHSNKAYCMEKKEFDEKMTYCRYVYEDAMPPHFDDFVDLVI